MSRRHRRSKVTRVVNLVKRIIAFFFSHIGLCALVVGYTLLGAFIFGQVEREHEKQQQDKVRRARENAINVIWNATFELNKLDILRWKEVVLEEVKSFQMTCLEAIKSGYDGKGESTQWSFPGAFLYSLSVITTIGYGNTSAKTMLGRVLTVLYAIIGIPLMLLFLTNIGDVMAKIFRFLYAQSIRLKFRIVLWHKKRKAAKIRRANSLVSRLTRGRVKADSSQDSLGPLMAGMANDVEDLLAARVHLEQLEVRENVQQQLDNIRVPLTLVIITMFAYLMVGAAIFIIWENWKMLESFYFCFISLTTIGFGDKFPGTSVNSVGDGRTRLIVTSIYLLFGMALLAMCFNLAQEEVQNKTRWIARQFQSNEDDDD